MGIHRICDYDLESYLSRRIFLQWLVSLCSCSAHRRLGFAYFHISSRTVVPEAVERSCTRSHFRFADDRPSRSLETSARRPASTSSIMVSSDTSQISAYGRSQIRSIPWTAPRRRLHEASRREVAASSVTLSDQSPAPSPCRVTMLKTR